MLGADMYDEVQKVNEGIKAVCFNVNVATDNINMVMCCDMTNEEKRARLDKAWKALVKALDILESDEY